MDAEVNVDLRNDKHRHFDLRLIQLQPLKSLNGVRGQSLHKLINQAGLLHPFDDVQLHVVKNLPLVLVDYLADHKNHE